jgi:hypothetical protein
MENIFWNYQNPLYNQEDTNLSDNLWETLFEIFLLVPFFVLLLQKSSWATNKGL